jgi:dTMP kinase
LFISLEGIDRSGKSTQAALLAEALGPGTLLLREPGGTEAGERVRALLKDPAVQLDPMAELLLFCAARAELVAGVIRPALEEGRHVVCDRFADSSIAYQGVARGLGIEAVEELNRIATGGLEPDRTVLIRIDPEAAGSRAGSGDDRFELEGIDFQRRLARAYDELADRFPQRISVVEGDGALDQVHRAVLEAVGR